MTRRRRLAAGVLTLAAPAAAALSIPALAAAAPGQVPAHLHARRLAFGRPVVVSGVLPVSDAGQRLDLQFLGGGSHRWQFLSATTVGANGHYRLSAPLRRSGYVRVIDATAGAGAGPVIGEAATSLATGTQHVSVAAALRVRPQSLTSLGGAPVSLSGRLLPGLSGRVVWLQAGTGHGWRNVAATKTGPGGRFTVRFTPQGAEALRVRFTGDAANARATAPAGTAAAYTPAVASWYYDGGQTGCGFHAFYGVANKSLPCGTNVTFEYGGRTVTATVDDRGPYVGGRTWDLNQNTAAALGFAGVGTVYSSF
jgi:hypothetical protein